MGPVDAPQFQTYNGFAGDFLRLFGFPNVADGPSAINGVQSRALGSAVAGSMIRIRANATGHGAIPGRVAVGCRVDWIYEFQEGQETPSTTAGS